MITFEQIGKAVIQHINATRVYPVRIKADFRTLEEMRNIRYFDESASVMKFVAGDIPVVFDANVTNIEIE